MLPWPVTLVRVALRSQMALEQGALKLTDLGLLSLCNMAVKILMSKRKSKETKSMFRLPLCENYKKQVLLRMSQKERAVQTTHVLCSHTCTAFVGGLIARNVYCRGPKSLQLASGMRQC
eukprot:6338423-Amphidinium_carterae.1